MLTFSVVLVSLDGTDPVVVLRAPALPRINERIKQRGKTYKVFAVAHQFSPLGGHQYTTLHAEEVRP